tara:strand:+ start:440 stop:874 length:435 start_codon:yes stop_codon:yes gene_type:complete
MARMEDSQLDEFLSPSYLCAFATVGKNGAPHITTIWYLFQDGHFFHILYKDSVKYRNLKRGSDIAVCIHDSTEPGTLSAYGRPTKIITPEDKNYDELHWDLSRRYFKSDEETSKYMKDIEDLDLVGVLWKPDKFVGFLNTDSNA